MELDDDNHQGGSNFDDGSIAFVLKRLTLMWTRERASPAIFMFEHDSIQRILTALENQRRDRIPDRSNTVEQRLTADLYKLELDRIRYIVTEYLRTRLNKIERHATYIVNTPEQHRYLSADELEFAKTFCELGARVMHDAFLVQLPEHLRDLLVESPVEGVSMLNEIPVDNYCIARVNRDVGRFPRW